MSATGPSAPVAKAADRHVVIYSDGGAIGNPGPGGYGVVMLHGEKRKELSGAFRLTTNNRMELLGAIEGLSALKLPCQVTVHTDSQYVVNGIEKGWAKGWKANGWKNKSKEDVKNPDLWARLLDLCSRHSVKFHWVKGHAGLTENERCDQLANGAARTGPYAIDEIYEASR